MPCETKEIWVFRGTQSARISVTAEESKSKKIFAGAKIADHWLSLAKADFATLNAALPVLGVPNEVYVFNQDQYARISLTPGHVDR